VSRRPAQSSRKRAAGRHWVGAGAGKTTLLRSAGASNGASICLRPLAEKLRAIWSLSKDDTICRGEPRCFTPQAKYDKQQSFFRAMKMRMTIRARWPGRLCCRGRHRITNSGITLRALTMKSWDEPISSPYAFCLPILYFWPKELLLADISRILVMPQFCSPQIHS